MCLMFVMDRLGGSQSATCDPQRLVLIVYICDKLWSPFGYNSCVEITRRITAESNIICSKLYGISSRIKAQFGILTADF